MEALCGEPGPWHAPPMRSSKGIRRLASLVLASAALLVAACAPPPPFCECFVCERAVTMSVVDLDGRAVDAFVVEAIVNDVPQGQPEECAPEGRIANSCSFGAEIGVYHLIVSAPGFKSREVVVRLAEEGAGDICCQACLRGREITVELEPL